MGIGYHGLLKKFSFFLAISVLFSLSQAQYPTWLHSDSVFINTTPDGGNIPSTATETNFPLLIRLHKDFFNFAEAQANGEDIRFATKAGAPLSYQIENWDGAAGSASIWVKIPTVTGNSRQGIMVFWGNSTAASESNGGAVFNSSNGYLSVFHMNDPTKDEVGTLSATNVGTTAAAGLIGNGRRFAAGQGIRGGTNITTYPTGSSPHSTEAWFKAVSANSVIQAWGIDGPASKVVMKLVSPPHVSLDSWFANGNVNGTSDIPLAQWVHVVYVYESGNARFYVNGVQDGVNTATGGALTIPSPCRMYIGGWYDNYSFVGDMDEVRISKVARSAAWAKMEYENQKPLQSMAGMLVPAGTAFSVPQPAVSVLEGQTAVLTGTAGGAQKIYWILKEGTKETVLAVDRLNLSYLAERVTADKAVIIQFKAIYPTEVKTQDITLTIKEDMPDPLFTLTGPATWNGRDAISLTPVITNQTDMTAKGVGALTYTWSIANIAAIKEITPGKLTLKGAQKSGKMTITLSIGNGGAATTHTVDILVTEPTTDPWLVRTPAADEKAVNSQFYARDPNNVCTVIYNGTSTTAADSVYVKMYAGTTLQNRLAQALPTARTYQFSPTITSGLVEYKLEFGTKTGGTETLVSTVNNLQCGDAYIIEGQSNAVGTTFGTDLDPTTSEWVRTFGNSGGNPPGTSWGQAVHSGPGGAFTVGYWGLELPRKLVATYNVPICILNGAVGGTRVDTHLRNEADPTDTTTYYGALLTRVQRAKLTHGIRGIFWHQGEADQGSDGPTGRWGWEDYQHFFIDMSASWKQDYPNIRHYYIFQIWPNGCAQAGAGGQDNMLREMQRTLPYNYSNMGIMTTIGVRPGVTCHVDAPGYLEFARLMSPLVERDNYGKVYTTSITPPDVKKAYFTSSAKTAITVEFDQPVTWVSTLSTQFYLDGVSGKVSTGATSGNDLTLTLNAPSTASKIMYLDSRSWSESNILYGANNIAALTFANVPIYPDKNTIPVISAKSKLNSTSDLFSTYKHGMLQIGFGRLAGQSLDIRLVNLQGQTVVRQRIESAPTGRLDIAVPKLNHGIYVLKVLGHGRTEYMKKLTAF